MRWRLLLASLLLWPTVASAQFNLPNDTIPDFGASPTKTSAQAGPWTSASTWTPSGVPGPTDVVRVIHPVTYASTTGDVSVLKIDAGGTVTFSTLASTQFRACVVMAVNGGALEIVLTDPTLTATVTIKNCPIGSLGVADPKQWGTGVLAIDGRLTLTGAAKTAFVRTDVEPLAGHGTVTLLSTPDGWRPGDRLFLPDSSQVSLGDRFNTNYTLKVDDRTLNSVAGNVVTLNSPLTFDHRGARDSTAGNPPTVLPGGIKLLPHVGNLTRNIVLRSENPNGTRGHLACTNRADCRIKYTQVSDMGRTTPLALDSTGGTNHIGRYPVHMHHLWGPVNPTNTGYQFELVGNAVADTRKWPIAVHASHYGLIQGNVIYGGLGVNNDPATFSGAGIALEDGSETENRIEGNFVAVIRGRVNARDTAPNTADGSTPGSGAECFWSAGFNNRYLNNVAATCRNDSQQIVAGPGWKFVTSAAPYQTQAPQFRGADMTNPSQTITVTPQRQAILEFDGNEAYGTIAAGMTIWQLWTSGYDLIRPAPRTVIRNFRVWHPWQACQWQYPINGVTVDTMHCRVDPAVGPFVDHAFSSGDYRNIDFTMTGGSIHAASCLGDTVAFSGNILFENLTCVARDYGLRFQTPRTPGTQAGIPVPPGIAVTVRNVVVSPWPGRPLVSIQMLYDAAPNTGWPDTPYTVNVENHQGQAGANFQAYWSIQAPGSGNTTYGGGPAPCGDTTTHPDVQGITCVVGGGPSAPSPPTALGVAVP